MAEELSSIHATRCKTKEKRPGGARHLRYVNKGGKGQHKETQRKTREEEERKKEKQERKKREEQERKKLEEEKRERETAGQALVEAAQGGKLSIDARGLINYMHEGKESARSQCIYAASSVWWAAKHGHFKPLEMALSTLSTYWFGEVYSL
jgi:membrane protein involved in colicin uptake